MRATTLLAALCVTTAPAWAQTAIPAPIQQAVDNPARPAADRADDGKRKPAETLAFAGIKAGDNVLDLLPGRGYFTQLFCGVVGPSGHIYQLTFNNMHPPALPPGAPPRAPRPPAPPPICANVTKLSQPSTALDLPAGLDLVWTSRNYHDLHNPMFGQPDMTRFDKSILAALKPGGVFMILDYVAPPGTGAGSTNTTHRIDPDLVKTELAAAGFTFAGESSALRKPQDDHTQGRPGAYGEKDQFIFKFRKPN